MLSLRSKTQSRQHFHRLIRFVYHSHINRSISLLIKLIHIRTHLMKFFKHLRKIIIRSPVNQLLLCWIHISRPIGNIRTLNCPNINFSLIIFSTFLSQQIHVFSSAIHTCYIQRSVTHVCRSVEDRVVIFQS